ncbi:MAG TPA: cyclase family protein [Acidimicrobiales bacterium]|nr:cyclase family protein [Acidimicrobiales bacterium]
MTQDDETKLLEDLGAQVRNWGRWGADDERGTLNLITAEKRAAAASLVRRGAVFSLTIPLDADGPQGSDPRNPRRNPLHVLTRTGTDPPQVNGTGGTSRYTDDMVVMHLQAATQWDALAHVFYDDRLYNGFPAATATTRGATRLGMEKYYDELVSRGVLLDIARLHEVETLPAGHRVTAEELDEACTTQRVTVEAGDIVLLRTGLMAVRDRTGGWAAFEGAAPGVHYTTATWFAEHGVAALACDNTAVESYGVLQHYAIPFHMLALRDMGMPLGEYWYLEELAADCADDRVYEFLLVAPGLRVTGAVGSPVTPLAMK